MTTMTLSPVKSLRLDYADYHGWQEGYEGFPGFALWNLKKAIPGHPVGSTVCEATLDRAIAQIHRNAVKLAEFAQLREHIE